MTMRIAGLHCHLCQSDEGPFGRRDGHLLCETCMAAGHTTEPMTDLERARSCAVALEQENALLRQIVAHLLGVDGDLDVELLLEASGAA